VSTLDLTRSPTVSGDFLESYLQHPDLRILDATVILDPNSWAANSGRATWETEHIPRSAFVDLIAELSDPDGDVGLPDGVHAYKLPSERDFAYAISQYGVSETTPVVVYDTTAGMWASRLWWLLKLFGNHNVAVLDGGWKLWKEEGRPISTEPAPRYKDGLFQPTFHRELLATKEDVIAATQDTDAILINALWPELFRGEAKTPLARPGRIPNSVNVPFTKPLINTGKLASSALLARTFASEGVDKTKRIITYCGGGIAATFDALALAKIGITCAVYDGSLVEWVADPDLPLETG